MKVWFLFLFLLLVNLRLEASVDVSNGNFFYSYVDGEYSSSQAFWQVQRSYNSRSNRIGIFGWGWCSPLETSLEIVSNNEMKIQNCGSGSVTTFRLKSSGRWVNANEELVSEKNGYIYKKNGVAQLQFGQEGKLLKFWIGMTKASVSYAKNRLSGVVIDDKTIKFILNDEGNVLQVLFPDGTTSRFSYAGQDLVAVENAWGNKYEYKYDLYHNLLKASWPDKTNIEVGYDTANDWVKTFKYRNGCSEKYKFQSTKHGAGGEKLETTVDKKCPRIPASVVTKYELILSSSRVLQRASRNRNGVFESAEMDEKTGKIKTYTDGMSVVRYSYNEQGELISKDSGDMTLKYVRGPAGQIQEIQWPDRTLKIQSDKRGRAQVLDLGGDKKIRISYVGDSERIKGIEAGKKGSVSYEYDNKGAQTDTKYNTSQATELKTFINEIYGTYVVATDDSTSFKGFDE